MTGFIGGHNINEPVQESLQTKIWGSLGSGLFGATAGAVVGFSQWLAIRMLKQVRFWIPLTIVGFALGTMLADITGLLGIATPGMHWFFSLAIDWVLPAILVALLQTVVLFSAGIRAYLWPLLGSTTILFAGIGYNFGLLAFLASWLGVLFLP